MLILTKWSCHIVLNTYKLCKLAGKPAFGGLPCSGTMTARQRQSADASMLCDGVLMSAGQYAGICNIMCARHVSTGGSIKQIVPLYNMECQQVEHMPVHIVRGNAACNLVYVINGMFTILAKSMHVQGGDSCMY